MTRTSYLRMWCGKVPWRAWGHSVAMITFLVRIRRITLKLSLSRRHGTSHVIALLFIPAGTFTSRLILYTDVARPSEKATGVSTCAQVDAFRGLYGADLAVLVLT